MPAKQAEYDAWLEQHHGPGIRDGIAADAPSLDPLIARHLTWVTSSWWRDAPAAAYAGLADTYLAHPDFVARYERIAPGFAEFLATAMRSWAARR